MQIDARRLARAEAAHDAGRKVGGETLDILANIDAMQLAIERATETADLEPADLLAIHRVLLEGAADHAGLGRFRDGQNWIGGNDYNPYGADFVPPPPEEVDRLIEDLCEFCNHADLPPMAHVAITHAQFETIHPFNDGNGRTGRALLQILGGAGDARADRGDRRLSGRALAA